MKAMIMAAGVGSRLMPMTAGVPKPMIPMANQPLMANTVRLLARHGFTELIANLHYHGDQIRAYFRDGSDFGVSMHYSPEDELLGTAGGVKRCAWFLDDTFVIVSGDALTDIDLTRLMEAHRRRGALATIALKEVPDVEHFGIVITDGDQRIRSFQELNLPTRVMEYLSRRPNGFVLITGPTGSGKTTVLSTLLGLVPATHRIVVVEDSTELRPDHPHVVRMQARVPNVEGMGAVSLRDLVRQALRMRPDRLVVGEVRGAEVVDLLAAMNTGHEGGMGTIHANSPGDVPARLEALGALAGMSREAVRSQVATAIHHVVHVARRPGGRVIQSIERLQV